MSSKLSRVGLLWLLMITILPIRCKEGGITTPEHLPVIWVSLSSMTFAAAQLGPNPETQVLLVKNSGFEALQYSISDDADYYGSDWITIAPETGSSGGDEVRHLITIDKTGLDPREQPYTAKITVQSSEAYNSPQRVDVSLTLTDRAPARFEVAPQNLEFTATLKAGNPSPRSVTIRNTGELTMNYQVESDKTWLTVSPSSAGLNQGSIDHMVMVNTVDLGKGTHRGVLTFSDPNASNSPRRVNVNLNLTDKPPPAIGIDTAALSFAAQTGADPAAQRIKITNTGEGSLNYTITPSAAWLSVDPPSGTSKGADKNHKVLVDTSGMREGSYKASLSVDDPAASNDPQTVAVSLTLTNPPAPPSPPPPATDNEIHISASPTAGGVGTIVTVTVGIKGNLTAMTSFGLDITFDEIMFNFVDYSAGSLSSSFAFYDGNHMGGGVFRVGAFAGNLPANSSGTVCTIRLQVKAPGSTTQIAITNFADGVIPLTPRPGSVAFTFQ